MSAVLNYGTTAKVIFNFSSMALAVVLLALVMSRFIPSGVLRQEAIATTANAATVQHAGALTPAMVARKKTIVLEGENGMIIGQLTKIAPRTASVSAAVDKGKGQELLSIVNRY